MFARAIPKPLAVAGLVVLLLCWGQASHAGPLTVEINVSTTPTFGIGTLDFQFNPAAGAAAATATARNFTTDGSLGSVVSTAGGGSGDLSSGSLSFTNSASVNEVKQNFTFGSFFDVFVDLNIPTPALGGSTTTFYLSMYDSTGAPINPDGFDGDAALSITSQPDGTFNINNGPGIIVTSPLTATPEPSTMILAALGAAGLAGGAVWRRRRNRTGQGRLRSGNRAGRKTR
jgi:MYXO-CTERM domain-containing protein